jgi:hypothetical protein
MLSAREFTVGTFGDAQPLSLVLPRSKYEEIALIGWTEKGPTAIFLSGQHAFQCFESAGNKNWRGLIVPGISVEVDETSLFDGGGFGVAVRSDTRLAIAGKNDRAFGAFYVTVHADLPPVHNEQASFSRWQVVLGEGQAKRVLTKVDVGSKE